MHSCEVRQCTEPYGFTTIWAWVEERRLISPIDQISSRNRGVSQLRRSSFEDTRDQHTTVQPFISIPFRYNESHGPQDHQGKDGTEQAHGCSQRLCPKASGALEAYAAVRAEWGVDEPEDSPGTSQLVSRVKHAVEKKANAKKQVCRQLEKLAFAPSAP